MSPLYAIYLGATLLSAAFFAATRKICHPLIAFFLSLWILSNHVFNASMPSLSFGALTFGVRMDRILLAVSIVYMAVYWALGKLTRETVKELPPWTRWGFLYFGVLILVDLIHLAGGLSLQEFIVSVTQEATFFAVFLVVYTAADKPLSSILGISLLVICVVSSLVGAYQFFGDPMFFRYGVERPAFAGFLRSNGVFFTDHIQGYFLITGFFVAFLFVRGKILRYGLSSLFLLGIVLSFHRMSWLVFMILMFLYLTKIRRIRLKRWVLAGGFLGTFTLMLGNEIIDSISRTEFVTERLVEDTGSYRVLFTFLAINNIPDHWVLGIGSPKSDEYYAAVMAEDLSEEEALGEFGGIHNAFFQIAYFKGVPLAILFSIFLIVGIKGLWSASVNANVLIFLGFMEFLKFAMAGLTNGILLGSEIGILMAIVLGIVVNRTRREHAGIANAQSL